jgi:hypothetical protein
VATIDSSMCWTMWAANRLSSYAARPDMVATAIVPSPPTHERQRPPDRPRVAAGGQAAHAVEVEAGRDEHEQQRQQLGRDCVSTDQAPNSGRPSRCARRVDGRDRLGEGCGSADHPSR